MIKKSVLVFSITALGLALTCLSGCNKDEKDKIAHLSYGHVREHAIADIHEIKELKYDDLKSKILHEESFLLAIYYTECTCWSAYSPILTEYINKYNVDISYIEVNQITNAEDKFGLYTVRRDMPSIAIFSKGKLLDQRINDKNSFKLFQDYSSFETYVNSKVLMPKMYYADEEVVDNAIENNEEFNLYVARSECPDCQDLDNDVLNSWNNRVTTVSSPLYILDLQKYYASKPEAPEEGASEEEIRQYEEDLAKYNIYLNKKKKYGLTSDSNVDFGFSTGSVPTLQRRIGNQITDMAVFLNDYLDRENKKIISYFTAERVEKMNFLKNTSLTKVLNGMSVSDEDIANWRQSARDNYNRTYHYPLAEQFIATYVK